MDDALAGYELAPDEAVRELYEFTPEDIVPILAGAQPSDARNSENASIRRGSW
jgi:hypothetical protein